MAVSRGVARASVEEVKPLVESFSNNDLVEPSSFLESAFPLSEPRVVLSELDFFDQHNNSCDLCNQGGDLLCCETCNLIFHLHCIRPKLKEVPPGDWSCAFCWADGLMENNKDNKNVKNAVKAKAAKACMEIEQMKVKIARDDNAITREDKEDHDNKITSKDDKEDEDHEDDEDNEDDKDHDNHDGEITSKDNKDNDDDNDDNNDDVGAFNNEVEGGVSCAPHSTLIKKMHILNQTPTYQCSIIEKDEIDLLIKKLLEMKLRREIGGRVVCGLEPVGRTKKKRLENTDL